MTEYVAVSCSISPQEISGGFTVETSASLAFGRESGLFWLAFPGRHLEA